MPWPTIRFSARLLFGMARDQLPADYHQTLLHVALWNSPDNLQMVKLLAEAGWT